MRWPSFQWASTVKINLSGLVEFTTDIIIISSRYNLYLPRLSSLWYLTDFTYPFDFLKLSVKDFWTFYTERTWWRLFQKRDMRNRLVIHVFIYFCSCRFCYIAIKIILSLTHSRTKTYWIFILKLCNHLCICFCHYF